MLNKLRENNKGSSLLEMVVALAVFTTITYAAIVTFQGVIQGQRVTIAAQNVQESLRFAFEIIGKEIRFAHKRQSGACVTADGAASPNYNRKVYDTDTAGAELVFVNSSDVCTIYNLNNNQLQISRGGVAYYITPDEVTISDLSFYVEDEAVDASPQTVQPRVTITLRGSMSVGPSTENFRVQTTISSRNYQ